VLDPGWKHCFDWYRSVDDPNVYVLVEAFRDRAAGEVHVKSEHFKASIARLPQLLADVPEIVNVDVPGDGWSRMAEVQVDLHH
jgi:quinol monooxygenase YgiN